MLWLAEALSANHATTLKIARRFKRQSNRVTHARGAINDCIFA
jgi:hypothetical protein